MKKILYTLFLLTLSVYSYSQIGINTENPKGLIHIDGASTAATTNPSIGSITDLEASDDVIINNMGNIGIGTLTPSTKLEIKSARPGAIKITDTTEGIAKMLLSDANGVGTWASVAGAWFAMLQGVWKPVVYQTAYTMREIKGFQSDIVSSSQYGSADPANGFIKVPFEGQYRISITGHWLSNRVNASTPYCVSPAIYVNGTQAWTGATIGYGNSWGLNPSFMTVLKLSADDMLTIYNDETEANRANCVDMCTFVVEFLM